MARTDNDRKIFAGLKEINAAAHLWQSELSAVVDTPPATPDAIQAAIAEQQKRQPQIEEVVHRNLAAIRNIFDQNVPEHEWGADVLVGLELEWKELGNRWQLDPAKPQDALTALRIARDQLDQIIYECMGVILSPDINDRLPNLEVGQTLDLEAVYGDRFPRDPAQRKRLIQDLAQEQAVIQCGIFDPDSGVIYCVAKTKQLQHRSVWRLFWLLLLGILLAAVPGVAIPLLKGDPISRKMILQWIANYVVLFVGVGGHTAIDALKQQRSRPKNSFRAMDDWLLWLHVREAQVRASILWADLGFLLLSTTLTGLNWADAFFAGYSIDSVTDLFLNRFEATVSKAVSQIKPPGA